MGVAVLYPEDFLTTRFSHNQPIISPQPKPRRSPSNRSNRRRRSPRSSPPPPSGASVTKTPVLGEVKILKRGEELTVLNLDSDLETVPVFDGFYAGSAFFTSPPPSSLPIPAMITKRSSGLSIDEAANDLRRILRLE